MEVAVELAGIARGGRVLRGELRDLDALLAQEDRAARGLGVRIRHSVDHASDAGLRYGFGAGRRLPLVPAGLERDVERGAFRSPARRTKRDDLRVRPTELLVEALADALAGFARDDDRAADGIRAHAPEPLPRETERARHPALVFGKHRRRSVGRPVRGHGNRVSEGHAGGKSPSEPPYRTHAATVKPPTGHARQGPLPLRKTMESPPRIQLAP